VTVPGQTPAVSADDRQAAERQFTEIYAAHRVRLVRYLAMLLGPGQTPLAEDMAQDAFIQLWRDLTEKANPVDSARVYGLLKIMGRRAIGSYYKSARNHEASVDYDAPDSKPLIPAGHSYAPDVPELHALALELDAAMQRMTEASELWRNLNKESAACRLKLSDGWRDNRGGLTPRTRQDLEAKAVETEAAEEKALVDFRETCRLVGQLRAELERAAGPNWRSSTGMPNRTHSGGGELSYAKDPTATHCATGHLLDRLNTAYTAEGYRRCRECLRAQQAKSKPRGGALPAGRGRTVDPEVIERARQLLADPALGHTVLTVAALLGVGQMTLYRAFPGGVAAVRQAALETAGAAR
jgi:DNA-directed RNA polymerase specialized sigma24 family protein